MDREGQGGGVGQEGGRQVVHANQRGRLGAGRRTWRAGRGGGKLNTKDRVMKTLDRRQDRERLEGGWGEVP